MSTNIVNLPRWKWMPGMLSTCGRRISWVDGLALYQIGGLRDDDSRARPDNGPLFHDAQPDFDDPATVGCLLALVREAWGFDDLSARRCSRGIPPGAWRVGPESPTPYIDGWGFDHYQGCVKAAELSRRVGIQPTEAAALIAALKAAP